MKKSKKITKTTSRPKPMAPREAGVTKSSKRIYKYAGIKGTSSYKALASASANNTFLTEYKSQDTQTITV